MLSVFFHHAALGRALTWAGIALVLSIIGCVVAALVFDVDAATIVWMNVVSGAALLGFALGALSARFGWGD